MQWEDLTEVIRCSRSRWRCSTLKPAAGSTQAPNHHRFLAARLVIWLAILRMVLSRVISTIFQHPLQNRNCQSTWSNKPSRHLGRDRRLVIKETEANFSHVATVWRNPTNNTTPPASWLRDHRFSQSIPTPTAPKNESKLGRSRTTIDPKNLRATDLLGKDRIMDLSALPASACHMEQMDRRCRCPRPISKESKCPKPVISSPRPYPVGLDSAMDRRILLEGIRLAHSVALKT